MWYMEPRKKASEVFNESNFVFGQKVPFSEAFPEIETISVEIKESGTGVHDPSRVRVYNAIGEHVNCSNPICYNGGFSIGEIVRQMTHNNQEFTETYELCQGYEGSPKGAKRYRE